jgi:uncharacterized protein (DUF58 family)
MIVPSQRLLLVAALIVIPCAAAAGLFPNLALIVVIVLLTLTCAVVADAVLGLSSKTACAAETPPQLRLIRGSPGSLPVTLRNDGNFPVTLRIGIVSPPSVQSTWETQPVLLSANHSSRIDWPCTGLARGDHLLDAVYTETPSPFGLWHIRDTHPQNCRLRVYPDLRDRETLALLRRGSAGPRVHRQVGKGREFEKLRDYAPGDSFEDIHWKATARRSRPVVKLYQVEHAQEVYLAIDHSRLTAREHILDEYVAAALHLALAAEQHGDHFGIVTFSDHADRFLRARHGPNHFRICRETIYNLEPVRVNPDFAEVFSSLGGSLQRRSLLVFFTALDDPLLAETFEREIGVLSRRHIVVVHSMQTRGVRSLFDGAPPASLDDAYHSLAGQMLWNRLRSLQRMNIVTPDTIKGQAAAAYLDIKRRQLL